MTIYDFHEFLIGRRFFENPQNPLVGRNTVRTIPRRPGEMHSGGPSGAPLKSALEGTRREAALAEQSCAAPLRAARLSF